MPQARKNSTHVRKVSVPMNRVEGDLEVTVEVEDGVVKDAWSAGVLYRGIEKLLVGRGAMDGLVITPRICGICSTSHLTAAARALDSISQVVVPSDAVRLRNVALMTEHIQSDIRQVFLMFATDLVNPIYSECNLFDEVVRRYEPFKGEMVAHVLRETREILGIVNLIGGQWPHSSYMVPGGIVSNPSQEDLSQCSLLLNQYRAWYEHQVLGCSIDRWKQVRSQSDLEIWLDESKSHRESDLGLIIRFCRAVKLDRIGRGHGMFISFGSLPIPVDSVVSAVREGSDLLVSAGFATSNGVQPFDQEHVAEHVAQSWYQHYEGGRHPFEGETVPYATGQEGAQYSWIKAPRYKGMPAETGPLAEMIADGNPLFCDIVQKEGPSAMVREIARLVRPADLMPVMEAWLSEVKPGGCMYTSPGEITDGEGYGLLQASRGALGHWVRIEDGAIEHYQVITPTGWNASPRDSAGVRGPIEEALIGTPVRNADDPVELGHIVRSFDPCLVCSVHTVQKNRGGR